MKDTVCIVGSHPDTRSEVDFSRTDCSIWVFNEAPKNDWCLRYDAVFQMHAPVIFRSKQNRNDPEHYQWLQEQRDTVIYMQDKYPEIPCSAKYPLDRVCEKLLGNRFDRKYFTSSVSYAIALAIYHGYKAIELYGVEMETRTEYMHQRDGVTFWLGVAVGFGVKVKVFSTNILLSPLYGYEGDVKLEIESFKERVQQLIPTCQTHERNYKALEIEASKAVIDFSTTGQNPENVVKAVQQQVAAAHAFGVADGARQENERYIKKMEIMLAESGTYTIVMQEYEQAYNALMKKSNEQMEVVNAVAAELEAAFKHAGEGRQLTRRRTRMQKFGEVHLRYIQESSKLGIYQGAGQENQRMMNALQQLIRMVGGEKSKAIMEEALVTA